MNNDKIPCCAADALRRIRQTRSTGSCRYPRLVCIAAVREQNPGNDSAISEALMKKIRVYNYIPPGVAEAYARAIMEEYQKTCRNNDAGN